jgi:hypothetical protein
MTGNDKQQTMTGNDKQQTMTENDFIVYHFLPLLLPVIPCHCLLFIIPCHCLLFVISCHCLLFIISCHCCGNDRQQQWQEMTNKKQ